ncbi:mRNA (2'-O-methyladenosine-N(6)-)-methyltransferase isoform X1 [Salvelinus alpinus]|uniref:mRNA (2'-O-methyladenosine-N(6)-)-methyltransferase isoform X1 n=1 Tax=Salvelinus alpinus TaxID=8036 RepID=UPI0039FD3232
MTSENHATVKVDTSMVMSPTGSATQGSPVSPSTSKPMPELPDELVQAGWSKCWSKRENRPYWFNRFTNQSLWEMPVLGQHDVISDPLGLNAAPAEGTGDAGVGNGQRKRRLSEEATQGGPNSFKRSKIEDGIPVTPTTPIVPISPITPGAKPWNSTTGTEDKPGQHSIPAPAPYRPSVIYWDLDVQTNAVIRERSPANHLPPHPEMELLRAQLTTKLRQHYHELCYQREGIEPPRESFNRWLLERKVLDKGPDPLLPSECDPIISPSMFREVMNDIPIRLSRIKYKEEARKLLFKYAEAAKRMIDSRNATPDSRKVVKWNAEDTMNWLRRDHSASKEDYMERLEHLRKQCGPHVAAVAKDSVEGICTKIYHISAEYVRRIHQAHQTLLKDCNVSDPDAADVQDRLVYCYPIRLALPSPAQPRVELHFENDIACLRYKGEMVKVNRSYFTKLELLYRYSSIDDPRFEKFLSRVWCLIKRYLVMFGAGVNEGTGLQGALPVPVFEALNKQFGVTFECFASPLNSYFKQFCSAFPDTDGFFGSRGPFLNFLPASGSFEANPPFSEEFMDAMVTHFEKLLEKSSEPLSFIIFVPEWRDPLTPALHRMETSSFLRHQMSVPAFEHEYRSGSQHICKKEEIYYKAVHGTVVIFLQNAAGFAKWEPTPERIQELLAAYQVSKRALGSPGPSSAPTTPSPASAGGSGDKDSIASKTAPERSASLNTSPARQDNSSSSNPVEKTTPPSETASI